MKIYVASSWRNPIQPSIVEALRKAGHLVYDFRNPSQNDVGFSWSQIDEKWIEWTPSQWRDALKHPIAQKGYSNDYNGMVWADACVMVMPCGRSAHLEAGWFAGMGKSVFPLVIDKAEPDLMYKLFDAEISTTVAELLVRVGRPLFVPIADPIPGLLLPG